VAERFCDVMAALTLKVAHGRETIELCVAAETTVAALKDLLAERCSGVLARNARMIHKGKTLAEDRQTLEGAGVKDGARLMLLAGGAPVVSTGSAALAAARATRPAAAAAAPLPLAPGGTAARFAAWSKTGSVSLRDAGLAEVPAEVWQVGGVARCLDLSGNPQLGGVGPQLSALTNLTRLHLVSCGLTDAAVAWGSLCSLAHLQTLLLDQNALSRLPDELGSLASLTRLSVARNKLIQLPASLCGLARLQTLDVSGNALTELPEGLGGCAALEELVLSDNKVSKLPASLARCQALKVLSCDTNHISCAGIPPPLLRAPALHSFSLRCNPCTIEELRDIDGFAELDARRRAKADKVIDGRVLGADKAFDESADAARNRKF